MGLTDILKDKWLDFKDNLKYHTLETVMLTGLCLALGSCVTSIPIIFVNYMKKKNLMDEIRIIADSNKDNIIDNEEWAKVYGEFGIVYDTEKPRNLTIREMEEYLSKYK